MVLVFLHGLPGVGKFTVGRELEDLTGFPLFHNHLTVDLVTTLFDFGSPEFVDLREHIWLEAFQRAAQAELPGLIFTFAGEMTVTDGFVGRVVRAVEGVAGEVVFVELACSEEELWRRVEDPGRREFGKMGSAELLDRLLADGTVYRVDPPESSRQIVVETTELDPAEAAGEVMRQTLG